jgi:hypothetical protein
MSEARQMIGAAAVAVGSAAVLALVREGAVDLVDGVVLVVSLAALARTAIRVASDPGAGHRREL